MSDSWRSSEENSVEHAPPPGINPRGGAMRVLFVLNGVVCCVLIAALVVFASRGKRSAEHEGDG
ncbi:MAG TPA: hypothetical protein VK137_18275 [Planctomycetaceae bacterium]|nr:hypothetical protein [Planctomycetaceae bacterium]